MSIRSIRRVKIPDTRLDIASSNFIELKKGDLQWQNDADVKNCYLCEKKFTMFTRKHHCRNCGKIICDDCSKDYTSKRDGSYYDRVCKLCYNCVLNLDGKNSDDCENYMKEASLHDDSVKQFIAEDFSINGAKVTKGSILTIIRDPNNPALKTIFKARVDDLEGISPNTTNVSHEKDDGGIKLTITQIVGGNTFSLKEGNKVYLVNLPEGSDYLRDDSPSRIIIKSTSTDDDRSYSSREGFAIVTDVDVGAEDYVTSGGYKHRKNKSKRKNKRSVRRLMSKRFNMRRKNKNKKVTKRMRKSRRARR